MGLTIDGKSHSFLFIDMSLPIAHWKTGSLE